jgi:hypothetical protein
MKKLIFLFLLSPVFCSGQWVQQGNSINGQVASARFGWSTAISANGTILAVGAPANSTAASNAGQVMVYGLSNGIWGQIGAPINGESSGDQTGESVSLSSNGSILAIGEPLNNDLGFTSGQVRVFSNINNNWSQIGQDLFGQNSSADAGRSVDLSADGMTLAFGAPNTIVSPFPSFTGNVEVYQLQGNTWVQKGGDINGDGTVIKFGESVSLSDDGNTIAIGQSGDPIRTNPQDTGRVKVYQFVGNQWVQLGNTIKGTIGRDEFGYKVSLSGSGNILAIGTFAQNQVKVFELIGGVWTQIGSTLAGESAGDAFGLSVSLSNDGSALAVGARFNSLDGTSRGRAYVFKNQGGNWTLINNPILGVANGDQNGVSVAISQNGSRVAVGATNNDDGGSNAGQVRVFENINVGSFSFNTSTATTAACIGPANMAVTLSTNTVNGFTNPISLSAVSGVPAGTNITFSNNPVTPGGSTVVTLSNTNTLVPGTYNISLQGTATSASTQTTTVSFVINPGASPAINTQPTNQTICEGANVSFSIAAPTASNFQWQVSTNAGVNWTNISGANNATLTLNAVVNTLNGNLYRCQASTICGNTNSNNATLTVSSGVSIVTNPADVDNCVGTNASFTVVGTSPQSINYQWQVSTDGGTNFNNIAGANSSMLTITNTTTVLNNNRYRCLLTTASCTTPSISAAVKLSVRALPTIALAAAPLTTLLPTQTTILTATTSTTNGGTLATSWFYNAAPLTVTGNNYTVSINQAGNYSATIKETYAGGLQCSNTSATVAITAVESDKLFIFPTPNDGTFNVTFYNSSNANSKRFVSVYDAKGALVYKKEFAISGYYTLLPINLKNASRGYYFVVVLDAAGKKLKEGKVFVR